jgi:hypothetical protein
MAVMHSQSHAQAYVQAPEMTVFSTTSYKHWKTLHTMLVTTLFRLGSNIQFLRSSLCTSLRGK